MNFQISLIFLLFVIIQFINAAKILVVVPFTSKSHHIFIQPIVKEIASRGHEVTFYTALSIGKNVTNIKEVIVSDALFNSGLGKYFFTGLECFMLSLYYI